MARGASILRSARAWLVAALASALLASWAWWPGAGLGAAPRCSAVLLDVSASVVRTRPDWERWRDEQLAQELRAAAAGERRVLVAAFARGIELLAAPARAQALELTRLPAPGLRDDASECAAALRALPELARGAVLERVLVLSDGCFTGADAGAAIAALRGAGVEFELRAPPPPGAPELELAELRAPRELEAGAPLALAARVLSRGAALPPSARAQLLTKVRDARGEREFSTPLDADGLAAGEVLAQLELGALAPGLTTLEARIVLVGARDRAPENDARATAVRSRGALVVRVVTQRPQRYGAWLDQLRALEGLQVLEPLAALEGGALEGCDVLLTLEVDPRELEAARLRAFVAAGGGWLALGQHALASAKADAARDPSGADATALLPLELRSAPTRDVVLLLDGSGSMDAAALAELRSASLALARSAPPGESLRLWWFTDRLREAFELEGGRDPAARERNRVAWARQSAPGGPTDIAAVLRQFAELREGAREALAVVITDGRDQPAADAARAGRDELFAALTRSGVRVAVVAAGAQADREWLDELARPTLHGRAWSAVADGLEQVLARESVREQLAPGGGAVVLAPLDPAADGDVRALRESWESNAPLPRAGAVLNMRARSGDELAAQLADGAPWLALRRHGEGWCALLTGEPVADSSAQWERAPALFAPLLRLLGRASAADGRPRPRAQRGDDGRWRVEGLPLDLPAQVLLADAERPAAQGGAQVAAHLPHDLNARDPRAQRVAASPGLDGARELLVLDAAGRELARAWVAAAPPDEFRSGAAHWPAGVLAPLAPSAEPGASAAPARRRLGLFAALGTLAALAAALACSNWGWAAARRQVALDSRR